MVVQISLTLVSTVTVGSGGAASVDITSIPQTGKDLLLLISARSSRADTDDQLYITFNGDTGTNYNHVKIQGDGSAVGTNLTATNRINAAYNAANSTSSTFTSVAIYISNYTSSVTKSVSSENVMENNATFALAEIYAQNWTGTSAISSINIDGGIGNLVQHSTASLYIIS